MTIRFDEDTGTYYDDEEMFQEAPPPPPVQTAPEGESLTGGFLTTRGKITKAMLDADAARKAVPERPIPSAGGDNTIKIIGYGDRLISQKPDDLWRTAGGEEAPIEYVDDIQRTLADVDAGRMSREQLKEKIALQAGKVPRKPGEAEVNEFDFIQSQMPKIEQMATDAGKVARKRYEDLFDPSDRAQFNPQQKFQFTAKLGEIERAEYDLAKRQYSESALSDFRNKRRIDTELQTRQATEWGLRERAAKGDTVAIKALKDMEQEKLNRAEEARKLSEKDMARPIINKLPELKSEATQADIRVKKYESLLDMTNKGTGGLVSGMKAFLAPVAEAMGMKQSEVESLSDAQVFRLMARAAVGSQRLMLVGSGQVSNYEQQLMQQLSGGSPTVARDAAQKLFKYYIQESKGIVDAYNTQVDNLSSQFPDVKKLYGYVGKKGGGGGMERITVIAPDGRKGSIPSSQLDRALKQGYKRE